MANDTAAISTTKRALSSSHGAGNLVHFRVDPELRAIVEAEADRRGCSVSAVIRDALTDQLAGRTAA